MASVSVIIPAYNQGHYLGAALQSVVAQTYRDLEIIVVDDGSTDNTREVAQGCTDPRLRYVYQANRGLSAARNTGLREARGEYLSFLDADDLFLPGKLERLMEEFAVCPELGLAAGQAILIDEWGDPLGQVFTTGLPDDARQLLLGNPLHVGSVLLRRDWQVQVGLFDESLRSYEDWDLWLRLARAGCRWRCVAQPVSLYRFHRGQMIRNGQRMTRSSFSVLDKLYGDAGLPADWRAMQDQAYSNAHLRAAAQAFQAGAGDEGRVALAEAVRLSPALADGEGQALAARAAAWATDPRTADPLGYLAGFYANLPDSLSSLRRRRRENLGQAAMQLAFECARRGERGMTRAALWRAWLYQPGNIRNRGALAIFLRSWLPQPRRAVETGAAAVHIPLQPS